MGVLALFGVSAVAIPPTSAQEATSAAEPALTFLPPEAPPAGPPPAPVPTSPEPAVTFLPPTVSPPPPAPVSADSAPAPASEPPPPPPPSASPPPPSGPPGVAPAASAEWAKQLAQMRQAAQARHQELHARVTDAAATVARLEADATSANAALAAVRAHQQDVTARLDDTESRLRQLEQGPRPSALVALVQRAVDVGRTVLRSEPRPIAWPRARRSADELLRQGDLLAAASVLRQQVSSAQGQTAAAETLAGAKAQELDAARVSLAADRAALSAATADMTFGPQAAGATRGFAPSAVAVAGIPANYLALYRAAAPTCPGLSWAVLAAIGYIESSHGRSTASGVHQGENFAGAMGPMQFLAPTWAAYGVDGDGDGVANPYNPTDAVYGAANYLCRSGAGDPARLPGAIWHYNHADWYVRDVLELASRYAVAVP